MAQDTGKQNVHQDENRSGNSTRADYTNLKGIYITKAVVQIVFGIGVIYAARLDYNLLPPSALIYLTGTLFDLIIATAMNKGPRFRVAVCVSYFFKWVNIIAEAVIGFLVLYHVDISEMDFVVFLTIGLLMICLGIVSSVVELILNRPNDD